jgi:hypothetical protein
MKYKKLVHVILSTSILVFLGQYLLFRIPFIYDLCLMSYLYDNASWVEERPKILFMGSSRCFHQLVPAVLARLNGMPETDAANVGQVAAGPFEMLNTYTKHLEMFRDVEFIFYVFDPDFFFESSHITKPYERILLSRRQWEIVAEEHGNFHHLPGVLFANAIRGSPRKSGENMGFEGLPHLDFLNRTFPDRDARYIMNVEDFPVSAFQVESMRKIKELCEKNGGILVFVLTPFWDLDLVGKDFFERARLTAYALDKALGPVRLIGSWEKEGYGLQYTDFMDNGHLALSGAEKLTAALFGDLEAIRPVPPVLLTEALPAGQHDLHGR